MSRALILVLVLGAAPASGAAPHVSLPVPSSGSFAAALDSVEHVLRSELGAWADSATWARDSVAFSYRSGASAEWRVVSRRVPALTMSMDDPSGKGPDCWTLEAALTARGWIRDIAYDADGPDGTSFALRSREALCVIQGNWDGGDDADSTYVPAPGHGIAVTCVPVDAP